MICFKFAPIQKGRAVLVEVEALSRFVPSLCSQAVPLSLLQEVALQTGIRAVIFKTDPFFTINIFISEARKRTRQK